LDIHTLHGERRQRVNREEIERRFALSGWDLDGSFWDYLVIGYSGEEISLLAHKEAWETDDPVFVILDHENSVSRWVHGVPTPLQARKLIHEHGKSFEESDLH
jgi:hypothetical protein